MINLLNEAQRKEITEVIDLGLTIVEAGVKTFADGKVTISDAFNLIPVGKAIPAAIKGIETLPDAFSLMDDEDRDYFVDYIEPKFDIPDDKVEEFCEHVVDWALHTVIMVFDAIELTKKEE